MKFIYPQFLFALAAVVVPVIIHLFNFRRYKKIYFTNVRFLKEVKEETTHSSKLKHLLILATRILAISFLVFAFAQPFIPKNDTIVGKGIKSVSIYIDNSFSMSAITEDFSLMDKAKMKAKEIVSAYKNDDRFQLLTNDFEGKHQQFVSKDEFLNSMDEIKISPSVNKITEILTRQKQILSNENNSDKIIFLISDFQKNIVDMEKTQKDTVFQIYFVPLKASSQNNVFIDSCYFESPVQMLNENNKLIVRIKNSGNENIEKSRMTLKINDAIKAISDFNIAAYSTVIDTINFNITQTGWHKAELSITDYPVTFDDSYFLSFKVSPHISILVINEEKENQYLNAVFVNNNYFLMKNNWVSQIDFSILKDEQFIILNSIKNISSGLALELKQFVEHGGSILVFPNIQMLKESYNSFLSSLNAHEYSSMENKENEVSKINIEEWIFKDVFESIYQNMSLPKVKVGFNFKKKSFVKEESLLKLKDGNSFVSKFSIGKGKLYMCSTPLDLNYTDLPVHSLFVPMIYKMAIASSKIFPINYNLHNDNIIEIDGKSLKGESIFKISGNGKEFIPEQKNTGARTLLSLHGQINNSGIYKLWYPDFMDSLLLAFNYDRRESELNYFDPNELEQKCKEKNIFVIESTNAHLGSVIREMNEGITLWKLCIIFALIFIGIEIVLLRFWK